MKKITFIMFLWCYSLQMNAQDTCLTATLVSPGTYTVSAINGTDAPEPCNGTSTGATAGEWYSYTPTINGTATVTTNLLVNDGRDTRMHVYTGTCGDLVCIGSNDDDGTSFLSTVTFTIISGTTYSFVFDNKWESIGFDFQLSEIDISCFPPSDLEKKDITTTSIALSWLDANTENPTWEIELGTAGFTQGTGTLYAGITEPSYVINDLAENTAYEFYIRTNCGGTDGASEWSTVNTFRTILNCDDSATYPYSENFVDGSMLDCWLWEDVDGSSPAWGYNTNVNDLNGDGNNDSFMVLFPQGDTETVKNDWLFSPKMGMVAGNSYNISVLYNGFNFNNTTANESFELIMVDTQSSTATFQEVLATYADITQIGAFGDSGGNDLVSQAYLANQTFTPTEDGIYYVAIRATTVGSASLFMVFNVSVDGATLGLVDFNQNTIKHIYNSTTGELTLMSTKLRFDEVELFNLLGQKVLAKDLSETKEIVDMSTLKNGLYFVKYTIDGSTKTLKVIKQ